MNLIKYYPGSAHHRAGNFFDHILNRSISDVVGSDFTMNLPAVNVIEEVGSFTIELAAPGLHKEDFRITVEEDKLLVSVEVKQDSEQSDEQYTRREFNYQSFRRSFFLPEQVRREEIEALYENGVLNIHLPTMEAQETGDQVKRIEVS